VGKADEHDEAADILLSLLLIALSMAIILLFVMMAVLNVKKLLQKRTRKRAEKNAMSKLNEFMSQKSFYEKGRTSVEAHRTPEDIKRLKELEEQKMRTLFAERTAITNPLSATFVDAQFGEHRPEDVELTETTKSWDDSRKSRMFHALKTQGGGDEDNMTGGQKYTEGIALVSNPLTAGNTVKGESKVHERGISIDNPENSAFSGVTLKLPGGPKPKHGRTPSTLEDAMAVSHSDKVRRQKLQQALDKAHLAAESIETDAESIGIDLVANPISSPNAKNATANNMNNANDSGKNTSTSPRPVSPVSPKAGSPGNSVKFKPMPPPQSPLQRAATSPKNVGVQLGTSPAKSALKFMPKPPTHGPTNSTGGQLHSAQIQARAVAANANQNTNLTVKGQSPPGKAVTFTFQPVPPARARSESQAVKAAQEAKERERKKKLKALTDE
jgi:hypothetical protein